MLPLVEKAREFALKVHGDQMYGNRPYIDHLDFVYEIISRSQYLYGCYMCFGDPLVDNMQAIAFLHDVLEDTSVTKEELANEFSPFIAECVSLISDVPGKNRKERKKEVNLKLKKASNKYHIALVVKVADRLANMTICFRDKRWGLFKMYKEEMGNFIEATFRKDLCDDLWMKIFLLYFKKIA